MIPGMGENTKATEATAYLELGPNAGGEPRGVTGGSAAIYVHFPFCRHICTYCDFDTFPGLERLIDGYVDAAVAQIAGSPRVRATSLYVGGGTPSLMSPEQVARLADACRGRFDLQPECEATLEANPSGLDIEKMRGFRAAGFNRLSIGVQSADLRLLRLLGRRHGPKDAEETVRLAREAGFENISLDLIYGVPKQDREIWLSTLAAVTSWGVEHLSCYALSVEAGTPMERAVERGTLVVPPDEEVVAMYEAAGSFLSSEGYHRYEISNWAKPGRESSHNLTYWRNGQYLAIGAGAAGCWGGRRYKLLPVVPAYIEGVRLGRVPLSEDEEIDRRRAMSDSLILGLRLAEGVSLPDFRARYGDDPTQQFGEAIQWGVSAGLLYQEDGRLRLTEQGILLSNELFLRLI
jgi:oxygen-independent coproporphyrinogen III oxidase